MLKSLLKFYYTQNDCEKYFKFCADTDICLSQICIYHQDFVTKGLFSSCAFMPEVMSIILLLGPSLHIILISRS